MKYGKGTYCGVMACLQSGHLGMCPEKFVHWSESDLSSEDTFPVPKKEIGRVMIRNQVKMMEGANEFGIPEQYTEKLLRLLIDMLDSPKAKYFFKHSSYGIKK